MFIAGIEIFFGFVAGSIILSLCVCLTVIAYQSAKAANAAVNRWWQRKVRAVRAKHPDRTILA